LHDTVSLTLFIQIVGGLTIAVVGLSGFIYKIVMFVIKDLKGITKNYYEITSKTNEILKEFKD